MFSILSDFEKVKCFSQILIHFTYMKFRETLRELRSMRGLGQQQLADLLKISVKTVSHWETGYSEPSIAQLIALADIFEVTLDDLVGRDI